MVFKAVGVMIGVWKKWT